MNLSSRNPDATNCERQMRRHFADAWLFGTVAGLFLASGCWLAWLLADEWDMWRLLAIVACCFVASIMEHYRKDCVMDYETARRQAEQIKNRG